MQKYNSECLHSSRASGKKQHQSATPLTYLAYLPWGEVDCALDVASSSPLVLERPQLRVPLEQSLVENVSLDYEIVWNSKAVFLVSTECH